MDQTIVAGAVVAIIVLCQFAKQLNFINRRAIPVIALVLGVPVSFVVGGVDWAQTAGGILVGLSAVGLYSGFRSTVQGK